MNTAMSVRLLPALVILVAMIAAPMLAGTLRPTERLAKEFSVVDLETLIPKRFGEWHEDAWSVATIVNPQQKELLDKLYGQVLSRTYVRASGTRVMLSIAYGGEQSDSLQVHKPEVCYAAQGFQILERQNSSIVTPDGTLPVTRVLAYQASRLEPVTYWIKVGDSVVPSGIHQKFAQLLYGFTGKIPDGMLVRVSTIDLDKDQAYRLQDEFLMEMLKAMTTTQRERIAGSL